MGNTSKRVIVALIAIPVIVAIAYIGKLLFLLFVLGISLISYYEFSLMLKKKSSIVNLFIGLPAVFLLILNQYSLFIDFEILFMIIVVSLLIYELFSNSGSAINNLGATLLGLMYIGLFGSSLLGIREIFTFNGENYYQGGLLIISVLASIWICDSAAFFAGTAFGKHKLYPRVSPKKSWEGAIFGFIFAILTMVLAKILVLDFLRWPDIAIIGLIVGVIGQIGDLVESLIKRDAGVKDSSPLIPGHGGVFDRFDSLLFTSPVIYIYLLYILS